MFQTKDCLSNGRSSCDVTHWFVDCCFEALSLHFGRRHLSFLSLQRRFLETEVTIFGKDSDAGGESCNAR